MSLQIGIYNSVLLKYEGVRFSWASRYGGVSPYPFCRIIIYIYYIYIHMYIIVEGSGFVRGFLASDLFWASGRGFDTRLRCWFWYPAPI